ncbi:MAG: hypothetical protein WC843_01775 [Candidatus Gracilibacteria bacterium]|jgi:hypothetical protein
MKLGDLKNAYPQKTDPTKPFAPAALKARALGSFFVGLMIASAGVAVFPDIGRVVEPVLCWGGSQFVTDSSTYSYKPGQVGVSRHFGCLDPATQTVTDQTLQTIFVSFLIYGISIFILMMIRAMIKAYFAKKNEGKGTGISGGASA